MTADPIAIVASGMVSSVGLSAPASCAAIRCAIDNFEETRFMDTGGEWILGSSVPLENHWRGTLKQAKMLAMAINECLSSQTTLTLSEIPVILCLSEKKRFGRLADLEKRVYRETQIELNDTFNEKSRIVDHGRVSIGVALNFARKLIHEEDFPYVVVAGVDSFLVAATLAEYEQRDRLLTSKNSNGFIPGEASAAVLVQAATGDFDGILCKGIGFGREKAHIDSEELPLRADGLVLAIREALTEARCDLGDTDFRITDLSGEQYNFKEASLALSRILRQLKEEYDIWHPADCIGEVGAAAGPIMLAVILAATRKNYSPGKNILSHLGNDDGKRAAMILCYQSGGAN